MAMQIYDFTPAEIEERKAALDWLKGAGFGDAVIDAVMMRDVPPYRKVRELVRRHGVEEAVRRLEELFDAG